MTLVFFQKGLICLRLLIISTLAVTLTGCVAPQQARQPSLTSERVWTAAKTLQRPSQRRTINIAGTLNTHTKNAKSNIVPASLSAQPDDKSNVVINTKPNVVTKAEPPQSAQPDDKSDVVINTKPNVVTKAEPPQSAQPDDKSDVVINTKPNVVTKAEPPQSAQPDDKSDPVITKAMATIAAKMGLENSASVELSKVKRAKKNALGKSIDTICGFVRGKNKSGADTGGRAFLYLVQEDEAYIEGYNLATSPYHNLCTQTASGLLEFLL
jgi:hypothetical protein